jgi:hypothetical protein
MKSFPPPTGPFGLANVRPSGSVYREPSGQRRADDDVIESWGSRELKGYVRSTFISGLLLGAAGVGVLWLVVHFSPVILAWRHG